MQDNTTSDVHFVSNLVPDELLMQITAQGNLSAFDQVFDRYYKPIYNFVRKNLFFDDIDCDDVTQEIFVRVFKSAKNFDTTKKLSSWIYQIAINEVRRYYKSSLRRRVYSLNDPIQENEDSIEKSETIVANNINPEADSLYSLRKNILAKAIDKLPDKQKMVVMLKVYQELTFEEISQILNCPLSTVLSRMRYAVRKLRTELEEDNFLGIINYDSKH